MIDRTIPGSFAQLLDKTINLANDVGIMIGAGKTDTRVFAAKEAKRNANQERLELWHQELLDALGEAIKDEL